MGNVLIYKQKPFVYRNFDWNLECKLHTAYRPIRNARKGKNVSTSKLAKSFESATTIWTINYYSKTIQTNHNPNSMGLFVNS